MTTAPSRHTSLVTGANTGLGRATAMALAQRGDRVILACRSGDKAQAVIEEISSATGNRDLEFLRLDLADLDSARAAAAQLVERAEPLHLLVANAGIAGQRGMTAQGFELAFGVNHLGHFALVTGVLDLLRSSAAPGGEPARLVVVSSGSHYEVKRGIDFDALRQSTPSLTGLPEYAVSKLANLLFVREVCRRVPADELFVVGLHPGNLIGTDVMRRLPGPLNRLMKRFRPTPEFGARTSVMCSTSADVLAHRGAYYSVEQLKEPSALVTAALAEELWRRSEEWCAATGA